MLRCPLSVTPAVHQQHWGSAQRWPRSQGTRTQARLVQRRPALRRQQRHPRRLPDELLQLLHARRRQHAQLVRPQALLRPRLRDAVPPPGAPAARPRRAAGVHVPASDRRRALGEHREQRLSAELAALLHQPARAGRRELLAVGSTAESAFFLPVHLSCVGDGGRFGFGQAW